MIPNSRVIYSESQAQFFQDVRMNVVSKKMIEASHLFNLFPQKQEINSWNGNVNAIKSLLELSAVKDTYVTFEYLIPYSRKRIDCVIYGSDGEHDNVIHIELKQWSNDGVSISDTEGNFVTNEDEPIFTVNAFTGGAQRVVAHPSQQVKGYHGYLSNFVEVISKREVSLTGLAYCYNYYRNVTPTHLFDAKYETLLRDFPTYAADDAKRLADDIHRLLSDGKGVRVFNKMINSRIRPSKKLLDEVGAMVENGDPSAFSLIGEQIVARNIIRDKIKDLRKNEKKSVILVKGGPGTGKTVIALHLIAELAKSNYNIHYATKSKPLLEGVRSQLRPDTRVLFSNVGSFVPASADINSIDVLLVDEAHRIQKSSNTQYTKTEYRTDLPQVDTLIRAAKVCVFFIDDRQAIRGVEIGSSDLIRESAVRWNANVEEVELVSQFRCNGSDNYLNWLEQVLYGDEVTASFDRDEFDIRIFDNPQELYNQICQQNEKPNQTARLCAGFCWKWTNHLVDGTLAKDVQIGNFAMPWETHGQITTPPKGYVHWYQWAYKPEGIKQVGCIYTAQGFEFDYIGVIIGDDLYYDAASKSICTRKTATQDPVLRQNRAEATMTFDQYVRNIYRVLMSRGMKGCYIYCCDQALAQYLQSLLDQMHPAVQLFDMPAIQDESISVDEDTPKILMPDDVPDDKKYIEYLPLYSIRAACGYFGEGELVEEEGWIHITSRRLNRNMFLVRASGHSMEPRIHDGDLCLFQANPAGSRQGKIVLALHSNMYDADMQDASIKVYNSRVSVDEFGNWQHESITLIPLNSSYSPIRLSADDEDSFRIIGEFLEVVE